MLMSEYAPSLGGERTISETQTPEIYDPATLARFAEFGFTPMAERIDILARLQARGAPHGNIFWLGYHSILRDTADKEELAKADINAAEAAWRSGGLLFYSPGEFQADDNRCFTECGWATRAQGLRSAAGDEHQNAVALAEANYEVVLIERLNVEYDGLSALITPVVPPQLLDFKGPSLPAQTTTV